MFQPVIPAQGLAGWSFLQNTLEKQKEAVLSAPQIEQDISYFADNIGAVSSASELVDDRRLLSVALTAFGLGDDIENRAFIQKVLEDGTADPDALANKLADDRYRRFSEAFGFQAGSAPNTARGDFAKKITSLYKSQTFEIAVGQVDDSMRVALNAQREIGRIATIPGDDEVKWLNILGSPPLRDFFMTGLGLPQSVGQLDIDRQLELLKDKAFQRIGSDKIENFRDKSHMNEMITSYFANRQIQGMLSQMSSSSVALTLLRSVSVS